MTTIANGTILTDYYRNSPVDKIPHERCKGIGKVISVGSGIPNMVSPIMVKIQGEIVVETYYLPGGTVAGKISREYKQ